jgi:phospholipid/cholesterol/gamma-HCH transport system substrate-binding protein
VRRGRGETRARWKGTLIANLAVLCVFLLGVYHVGFDVLRLQLARQPFTVRLELASAGGLYPRSEVTYRGTLVGKVTRIALRPEGVVAYLRLDEGTKIPDDADAVVSDLSPAGEQFVDLRPRRATGPFLGSGSVIPASRSSTPVPTAVLMRNLAQVLNQVESKDLNTVIDELALALEGTGPELARLVDRSDHLLAGLQEALPSTLNVLRNGKTNLDTANDLSGQFATFNRRLRELSAQLRSSDPKVRRLLDKAPASVVDLDDFLSTLTTPVYLLMVSLVTPSGVITARLPALRGLLIAFPQAANALATTLKKDGNLGIELHITDNPVCEYGGKRRLPIDARRVAPNLDRVCAVTAAGVGARGAQNAPRRVPSGPGAAGAVAGASSADALGPTVRTYDPASGVVRLPDGTSLSVGLSGTGAGRALGMSWIDVLLGLLRS